MLKRFNNYLHTYFLKLFIIFLIAQPAIDIITSVFVRFFDTSVTLGIIIRMLMLIAVLYYSLFVLQFKRKKYLVGYIVLIGVYAIIYVLNVIIFKDVSVLFTEVKSLIKLIYFPVMLASLFCIFEERKDFIKPKNFITPGIIYVLLIIVALITNTSFFSYPNGKLGSVGWFYAPNEIGAILAMIFPVFLVYIVKNYKRAVNYIFLVMYIFVCLWMGTKAPMLGIMITFGAVALIYLIKLITKKQKIKSAIVMFSSGLLAVVIFFALPYTPGGKNLNIHLDNANVQGIQDFFDSDDIGNEEYEVYVDVEDEEDEQDMCVHDGISQHSVDNATNVIYSSREKFLKRVSASYHKASLREKILGMGYVSDSHDTMNVMVEMDFYDVFFRLGVIGSIIYFMPLVFIAVIILIRFLKRFWTNLCNDDVVGHILGVLLALGLAYIAGHVLTAPAASLYVALLIIGLYKSLETRTNGQREDIRD